ncbi:MAG: cytochrome-c peroxidase [Chloroflexota bacterium]
MSRQTIRFVAAVLLILAVVSVALVWRNQSSSTARRQQLREVVQQLELQPVQPPPPQDPALVALGEALFFETELSGNRDVSCATCHHPELALGDGLPLSIGTGGSGIGPAREADPERPRVPRNTIALFNSGLPDWDTFFWDGRVQAMAEGGYATPAGEHLPEGLESALAAQAMFPVTFRDEMRGGWYDTDAYIVQPGTEVGRTDSDAAGGWHDVDVFGEPNELASIANGAQYMPQIWRGLMARLLALPQYRELFAAAYPDAAQREPTFVHAANALAAYQSEAFTAVETPWDRFLAGNDEALPDDAIAGALLFYGKAGCASCHSGPLLSDQKYHNIGAPQFGPGTDDDAPLDFGRWRVTGEEAERFAFRTPPLRHVAATGPWLHNGAYDSLENVIRHHLDPEEALRAYDGAHLSPALKATVQNEPVTIEAVLRTLDPALGDERRLNSQQVGQIVSFLEALGDGEFGD